MSPVSILSKLSGAAAAASATPNTSSTSSSSATSGSGQTLNQNDFLKLLVAQLQYQDPTNPQSDTQMAAQMAQFSTLTASTQTSSSLAMLQANSLVGTTVTVQTTPGSNTVATGTVTGVDMSSGSPQIIVKNSAGVSTSYNLNQVLTVLPATTTPATTTPVASN